MVEESIQSPVMRKADHSQSRQRFTRAEQKEIVELFITRLENELQISININDRKNRKLLLTQADFCEEMGISQGAFSLWYKKYRLGGYNSCDDDLKHMNSQFDPLAAINYGLARKWPYLAKFLEVRSSRCCDGYGLFTKLPLKAQFSLGYFTGVETTSRPAIGDHAFKVSSSLWIAANDFLDGYLRYCNDSHNFSAINVTSIHRRKTKLWQWEAQKSVTFIVTVDVGADEE